MAFTEYLFDKDEIQSIAEQAAISLKQNKGFSDLEGYAVGVIVRRLEKDPMRYRDYGMYWGALKEVLRKHGHDFGAPVYPMLKAVYCGDTDLQTIVMADEFRKFYLATYVVGTHQFILDSESPEHEILIDDDMERLVT